MTAKPVDPQIQEVIDAMAAMGFKPVYEQTPAAVRALYEGMAKRRRLRPAAVAAVEDRNIPGPGGDLAVRVYRPVSDAALLPVLVYFHGGGHVIGSLDTYDPVARNLCAGAGCVVVSVAYRLAPEHRFPGDTADAFAAVQWCAAHGAEIGVDPARMAVAGDSSGGTLATVAALMARDAGGPAIRLQVLIYPTTDCVHDTVSFRTYAKGYGMLEARTVLWFRSHYLRDEADLLDWRASPLRAADLSGLPPAMVLTAECDVLRDEGEAYADRLRSAGVEVEYRDFRGMIHGFFEMAPVINGAVRAQATVCDAIRRAVARGPEG